MNEQLSAWSIGVGFVACLACSSSSPGRTLRGNGADGPGPSDGNAMTSRPGPAPGEAPVIQPVAPSGVNELEVPEFPAIFGSGFGGTEFPSSTCKRDCNDFPAE